MKNLHEQIKSSTFLITGGAGFIGSNIALHLVKNDAKKVVVIDDLSTGFEKNLEKISGHSAFHFIKGDIRNPDDCKTACAGIDYVLHQAALGSVPRSIDNPAATNSVNVDGFLNMLCAAKDAGVKRFVYASSSSVYGDDPTMPKKEENTGQLLSPYAVSKRTNEEYAKVFHRVYGMKTIGLRYFNVFGPHQNVKGPYAAVIPLFISAILQGKQPTIFGDGENTRDFTFIDNVVQANLLAALAPWDDTSSPVVNIAFGGTVSLNRLYKIIADTAAFDKHALYAPERKGDIRNSFADISKAKKLLGYQPGTGLEEGLAITFRWFHEQIK